MPASQSGVLIHVLDGWEQNGVAWAPATNGPGATDMSASLIFAASVAASGSIQLCAPYQFEPHSEALRKLRSNCLCKRELTLYSSRVSFGLPGAAGLIFRPGVTRIRCGKADDSAGHCGRWCGRTSGEWVEAYDKLCAWRPQDLGSQLQRLTEYQLKRGRYFYNEIIIDAPSWRSHLPRVIEGIYGSRELHRAFVVEYGLDEDEFPLLQLDRHDRETPFSLASDAERGPN
jgi:hypothetical protein